ncbi:Purine nucleoside phosphorylase 1 [Proteus vulgaris]|nr:Purine nucleoside phosphorylase 1 [Proteus vulgaris]
MFNLKRQKKPTVGIILGSGLGSFADTLEDAVHIPYHTIPYFAASGAVGHANELVIGKIAGKTVVAMKGRFHYYEGVSLDEVNLPCSCNESTGS